jgi:hypothetical protein
MASGEPLAGVKQTLKEKRTSETTALDFVPSWAGQLQFLFNLTWITKVDCEQSYRKPRSGQVRPAVLRGPQSIGPEDEFLGIRLERVLDCDESVVDHAVEGLGLGQTRELIRDTPACFRPLPMPAKP